MTSNPRFERALKRNFDEVLTAILELRAYNALVGQSIHGRQDSFFFLSAHALYNDLIARAIKVLEKGKASSTFWYLYRCEKMEIDKSLQHVGSSITVLDALADKLKKVRNKTHFHLDKHGIMNPRAVWKDAGIKGDELQQGLTVLYEILKALHYRAFKSYGYPLEYGASDVSGIVDACRKAGVIY